MTTTAATIVWILRMAIRTARVRGFRNPRLSVRCACRCTWPGHGGVRMGWGHHTCFAAAQGPRTAAAGGGPWTQGPEVRWKRSASSRAGDWRCGRGGGIAGWRGRPRGNTARSRGGFPEGSPQGSRPAGGNDHGSHAFHSRVCATCQSPIPNSFTPEPTRIYLPCKPHRPAPQATEKDDTSLTRYSR